MHVVNKWLAINYQYYGGSIILMQNENLCYSEYRIELMIKSVKFINYRHRKTMTNEQNAVPEKPYNVTVAFLFSAQNVQI